MNSTAWKSGAMAALCWVLAVPCNANTLGSTTRIALVVASCGQQPAASLTKPQVLELLAQGRQELQRGNLSAAAQLLQRAETSGVTFGAFESGDTPRKFRRDLQSAQQAASQRMAQPPVAPPLTTDPRGAGVNGPRSPMGQPASPTNPFAGQANPSQPPAASQAPARPNPNALGEAVRLMRSARVALAEGDVQRATTLAQQAKQLKVTFRLGDDSPARVEAAIARYRQVVENRNRVEDSSAWRQHYATILHEQAESLLAYGEWDQAERLATDALQLGGPSNPYAQDPRELLRRIDASRRGEKLAQTPAAGAATPPAADRKTQALEHLAAARQALAAGNIPAAQQASFAASQLGVPESAFAPGEDRPSQVALAIQAAKMNAALPSVAVTPPTGPVAGAVEQSLHVPSGGTTYNAPAQAEGTGPLLAQVPQTLPPATLPPSPAEGEAVAAPSSRGFELLEQGEAALRQQDLDTALARFREAYQYAGELDVQTQQRLQGHLQMLSAQRSNSLPAPSGGGSMIDAASESEQLAVRQLSSEITKQQSEARKLRESSPREALTMLKEARQRVEAANIGSVAKTQLLRRVDLGMSELESYIERNRAQLELDDRNREVLAEIDRRREMKVEVQGRIAELVDQFNQLNREQRWEEAEVVARRLREIAADDPVVEQVWQNMLSLRRERQLADIMREKEEGIYSSMTDVERGSVPNVGDNFELALPDDWGDRSERRLRSAEGRRSRRRSTRELEIERRLRQPIVLNSVEEPLAEVIDKIGKLAGINIHLDERGMEQEGVRTNTPVTIKLNSEISVESALNLILNPLHLDHVIQNEVLKITSEQLRDEKIVPLTYGVADLVIPIPNFVTTSDMGLQGMINDALAAASYGQVGLGGAQPSVFVAEDHRGNANSGVLAQQAPTLPGLGGPSVPIGGGPAPGMGGGAQADFDALIDLITSTIKAETWEDNGGPSSIKEFRTNLSLVVATTQEVHDEIADLLEQLRRLQDLQVTIEVRFITLSDDFFERIGVDFDFNIEDGPAVIDQLVPGNVVQGQAIEGRHRSATVGLLESGTATFANFTADLDIPFRQGHFPLATPAFGTPVDVASFGFAILSDIEAYFLVSAAQGDRRSNVLEAPKVTLFNGQLAFVTDNIQRPFVISVIPVVGDFAAAQQPVIVTLSEGTTLSIQAVVSEDRRYVRLTVVPFFSQIGDVEEFTFEGTTTSISGSSNTDADDDGNNEAAMNDMTETRSGTTVQLPTFEVISVATTVSVPDGGTVLLGGIKRLSEGRNEFGVPLLSKIPYVNRLFRNVGIGRETESLMMMVTPRIIIQEEEETRLLGGTP